MDPIKEAMIREDDTGERDPRLDSYRTAKNTDRELYREPDTGGGSYYSDSIHVTQSGGIGINCGGHVIVLPLRKWHALAVEHCTVCAYPRCACIKLCSGVSWVKRIAMQLRLRESPIR